jgi:hypothetical protein
VIPRRRLLLPLLSILVSELIACARMHECTRACAQMCAHGESSFNTKVAKLGKLGRRPRRTAVGAARCSSTFLERDSRFCHHAPRLRSIAALARLRGKGGREKGGGCRAKGAGPSQAHDRSSRYATVRSRIEPFPGNPIALPQGVCLAEPSPSATAARGTLRYATVAPTASTSPPKRRRYACGPWQLGDASPRGDVISKENDAETEL